MTATYNCNTEESFVFASVFEFVKTWASGQKSSLLLECDNGQAWLQLGFRLSQPSASHIHSYRANQPSKRRRNRKSPSKAKRDREHAVFFNSSRTKVQDQDIIMEGKAENDKSAVYVNDIDISIISEDLQQESLCVVTPAMKSNLSVSESTVIDNLPPILPPPPKPNLSIDILPSLSIPPRPVYLSSSYH